MMGKLHTISVGENSQELVIGMSTGSHRLVTGRTSGLHHSITVCIFCVPPQQQCWTTFFISGAFGFTSQLHCLSCLVWTAFVFQKRGEESNVLAGVVDHSEPLPAPDVGVCLCLHCSGARFPGRKAWPLAVGKNGLRN